MLLDLKQLGVLYLSITKHSTSSVYGRCGCNLMVKCGFEGLFSL